MLDPAAALDEPASRRKDCPGDRVRDRNFFRHLTVGLKVSVFQLLHKNITNYFVTL